MDAATDGAVEAAVADEIKGRAGGLSGLLGQFGAGGLGDIAESWVGKGDNKGISAAQIKTVLSSEEVQGVADKLGISPDMAADKLAEVLPGVVDKLTPDGVVPDPDALSDKLTGFLKSQF